MSNESIKQRITKLIKDFKANKIDLRKLRGSIELDGRALEMMPFSMIKDLEEIEYKSMVAQFAQEEDCAPKTEEVIELLEAWLRNVPVE